MLDPTDRQIINLVNRISLDHVGALLVSKGWEPLDAWPDILIYRRPESERVYDEVVLPKSLASVGDFYVAHILTAAQSLADYEKRTVEDVLSQWSNPGFDRVKFRLVSDKVEDGSAPLYYVRTLVDGVVSTLRSAIKDVEQPERRHIRSHSPMIDELMKQAELGQTEKGSYVVNVLIPCESQVKDSNDAARAFVYRQGLEHLLRTLNSAVRYAESDAPDEFLNARENAGVSANLLEAVLKTRVEDEAELEISVEWSPLSSPSPGTPDRVYLTKKHAQFLQSWASVWLPRKREETRKFTGVVLALDGRYRENKDGRPYGQVVFKIRDDDAYFDAETLLNVDDFKVAYDAFYQNDEISLEGRVVLQDDNATLYGVTNVQRV